MIINAKCALFRSAYVLILALAAMDVRAAPGVPADLELSAHLEPSTDLVPGDIAKLTLVFTNHGPGDMTGAGAGSSDYTFLDFAMFELQPSYPYPCATAYDDFLAPPGSGLPSYVIAIISAGPVPAHSERRCTFDVPIFPRAHGDFTLIFDSNTANFDAFDPDFSNNQARVTFQFAGSITPVPLGTPTYLFLAGLLAAAGMIREREARKRCGSAL